MDLLPNHKSYADVQHLCPGYTEGVFNLMFPGGLPPDRFAAWEREDAERPQSRRAAVEAPVPSGSVAAPLPASPVASKAALTHEQASAIARAALAEIAVEEARLQRSKVSAQWSRVTERIHRDNGFAAEANIEINPTISPAWRRAIDRANSIMPAASGSAPQTPAAVIRANWSNAIAQFNPEGAIA